MICHYLYLILLLITHIVLKLECTTTYVASCITYAFKITQIPRREEVRTEEQKR